MAVFRAAGLAFACAACTSMTVDARTFESTNWRVAAIDGKPTPAKGDYRIEFAGGRISGRFGCNSWGGSYAVAGETLTTSRIISTMMACPGPSMTFEREGLGVLRQPMRWTWTAGTKLMLSNSTGSITLERTR